MVAVATINEEDFDLSHLTVAELEKLQGKVRATIAEKLTKEIPFTEFDFSPPDDRSYGTLTFEAKTLYGVLQYEGSIDSNGGAADAKVSLFRDNAEPNDGPDEVGDTWDGIDGLHVDVSDDEAKTIVVKAVLQWQGAYAESLEG